MASRLNANEISNIICISEESASGQISWRQITLEVLSEALGFQLLFGFERFTISVGTNDIF